MSTSTTAEEVTMNERLVRVETKLDLLIADLSPRLKDHEDRLRALERRVWSIGGGALAGGSGLGALIAHFTQV